MYKNAKKEAPWYADVGRGSFLKLSNPFAAAEGGIRYPLLAAKLIPSSKWAARISAMGACSLLGAAVIGGIKSLAQQSGWDKLKEYTEPDYDIRTHIGTTFNSDLSPSSGGNKKKKKKQNQDEGQTKTAGKYTVKQPGIGSYDAYLNTLLPLTALIVSSIGTYKGMDKLYEYRRNAMLDESIARKSDALRNLMQTRARLGKGVATDKEILDALNGVKQSDVEVKTAGFNKEATVEDKARELFTKLRLLLLGVGVTSAIGSYKYFRAADPEQIKFKAYKKALETYSKSRALHTPLTILPKDMDDYFAYINGDNTAEPPKIAPQAAPKLVDADDAEDLRGLPEIPQSNKPISITL